MTDELLEVPRFTFNTNVQLTPEQIQEAIEAERRRTTPPFTGESQLSPARHKAINMLIENHNAWAKERLGISLAQRQPQLEKIHYLTSAEFQKNFGSDEINTSYIENGYHVIGSNELFLVEMPTEAETLAYSNHELVHQFGHQTLYALFGEEETAEPQWRTGYAQIDKNGQVKFHLFNEVVTEMINRELLCRLKDKTGNDFTSVRMSYAPSVILFDMIFEKTARRLSLSRYDFQTRLYTGAYTGEMSIMSLFKESYNSDVINTLEKMNQFSLEQTVANPRIHEFGIASLELAQRITRYFNDEEIPLMNGELHVKSSYRSK